MKKAQILLFYLVLFIVFIEAYCINIKIISQKAYEYLIISELNKFSFIESDILIRVIHKFHIYKPEDFVFESELGLVYVYYLDEVAYIKYDYDKPIYARLDYDLVYDSCYNYELIDGALFPVVDKLNSSTKINMAKGDKI